MADYHDVARRTRSGTLSRQKPVIVLSERDADMRRILRDYLARSGFVVREAIDGAATVGAMRAGDVDAVVLDVALGGVDGFKVARRIRLDEATAHVPIIATTASAFANYESLARAAGCDAFLSKPFSPTALLAEILKLLAERARARAESTG